MIFELPRTIIEEKTGIRFFVGPQIGEREIALRDWRDLATEEQINASDFSMSNFPQAKIDAGNEAIAFNELLLSNQENGSPLEDEVFSPEGVVLFGAGFSLNLFSDVLIQKLFFERHTTIATNRAISLFRNIPFQLDYAFICDPDARLIDADGWLKDFKHGETSLIAAMTADEHFTMQPWKKRLFYTQGIGSHKEIRSKLSGLPVLDCGFCALFAQLHLCYQKWVAGKGSRKIYLLGHDFSLVNNHKYFDQPYLLANHDWDEPGLQFVPVENGRGELIFSQMFLVQQALTITFLCSVLRALGMEIYNLSDSGCLVDPCFLRYSIDS